MKVANTKRSKKTLSCGRRSEITHLEEQIIGYGLDLRARGLDITYITLQVRACQIDEVFRQKNKTEQYQQTRRLAIANCLVPRRTTHVGQQDPNETMAHFDSRTTNRTTGDTPHAQATKVPTK